MKEYRIIRTRPAFAIVNVKLEAAIYAGYTEYKTASEDLEALRIKHPEMAFQIVPYITLDGV